MPYIVFGRFKHVFKGEFNLGDACQNIQINQDESFKGSLDSWWLKPNTDVIFPLNSINGSKVVHWISSNEVEAKIFFQENLLNAFEFDISRWANYRSEEIPKDEGPYKFISKRLNSDFWRGFLSSWGLVFATVVMSTPNGKEPSFIKLYPNGDVLQRFWLLKDGITPKAFKLRELLSSPLYFVNISDLIEEDDGNYDDDQYISDRIEEISKYHGISSISDHDQGALTFIVNCMGFKDGKVSFISLDHNEWDFQNS